MDIVFSDSFLLPVKNCGLSAKKIVGMCSISGYFGERAGLKCPFVEMDTAQVADEGRVLM